MHHRRTHWPVALAACTLTLAACSADSAHPLTAEPAPLHAVLASAAGCSMAYDEDARTVSLLADCSTTASILVPHGFTLDGNGHTITAVEGFVGPFLVRNADGAAFVGVRDLVLTADIPTLSCTAIGGVGLVGTSGSINDVTVRDVRRGGANGCNGTVGILVDNPSRATPVTVSVTNSRVENFLRTGIRIQGNVTANLNRNRLTAMDGVASLTSPNAVAFAAGASGQVHNNHITAQDWDGAGDWGAVAIYLNHAGDVRVTHNVIDGEMDLGVDAYRSGTVSVINNTLVRSADGVAPSSGCLGRVQSGQWLTANSCDPYGVGVSLTGSAGKSKAIGNTFSGWNANVLDAVLDRNNG